MRFALTDEQHLILEMIAEGSVLAIPELDTFTAPLVATKLITRTDEAQWQLTRLGEAMLERHRSPLH
jgi:hypothetical protein